MGRITAPFGIKGWVKARPFTASAENLLAYPRWWIGDEPSWQEHVVEQAHVQGVSVVAKLAGCEDRDCAAGYRGQHIAVPRDAFPPAGANEFYWADLVGLEVTNEAGETLGVVFQVVATGSNDVLVVKGDRERLIPFTEQVVRAVDLERGVIHVDWGSDY